MTMAVRDQSGDHARKVQLRISEAFDAGAREGIAVIERYADTPDEWRIEPEINRIYREFSDLCAREMEANDERS